MAALVSVIFNDYRRKVLGLLLLSPDKRYHVREIARLTSTVPGSLHRELSKLAEAQLLTRETVGKQVYYQANRSCPIFEELASILRKTSGLTDVLAAALAPVIDEITAAFVFGSIAQGTESSQSDVDVLIIGDIGFAAAVSALYTAQATLGREINPKVYTKSEWLKMVKDKNAFVQDILSKSKLFVIGSVNELG